MVLVFVSSPLSAYAAEGSGTFSDPVRIDGFPWAHASDTTGGGSVVDRYSCASTLDEGGPERVYRFELDEPGIVTAWVEGDVAGSVDIDVHLLSDDGVSGGTASCEARGNLWAEARFEAGSGWVVVDSYVSGGRPLPGPYVLRVDVLPFDRLRERTVAEGVIWRSGRFSDLAGGTQTVNILEIDLSAPGLRMAPAVGSGCTEIAALGAGVGATAGVNAGFFDASCRPVGLVRIDGVLLATNPSGSPPRTTLGLGDGGPRVERIAGGVDWPEVEQALGGLPGVVQDGRPNVLWSEEGAGESFATSRHPRTLACVTTAGRVLFVTFDGRTAAGIGVSLAQAAEYLVSLGCEHGLNYDGGGSTTMWIAGQAADGVVNYPSDNGVADHLGSRAVANGWFVWASPFDHPPRFTTTPPTTAVDGVAWRYDADAIDLDLQPLTFRLVSGPAAMVVDPRSGEAVWTPGYRDGGEVPVVLEVTDGTNRVEQSFLVTVAVRDRDADGLPDAWEEERGTDPDRDDAREDPDGDGFDNATEYGADTDPLDPTDPGTGTDGDADGDADGRVHAPDGADAWGEDGLREASDGPAVEGGAEGGCGCRAAGASHVPGVEWAACLVSALVLAGHRRRARVRPGSRSGAFRGTGW